MVGTAQADNFSVFVRKIGYSVGLESILSRASDFGRAYANVSSFRDSDWTALVEKTWNLKSPHIADVFGALDIAKVHNREIYPGTTGESLGILFKLHRGTAPERAIQFMVASAIVRADGDIFLNALRSSFNEIETGKALVRMVQAKRETLFRVFSAPRDREAVARAVSIERQRANKGSASGGRLGSLIAAEPLSTRARGLGLPRSTDIYSIDEPSSDYLRKITVSRRGWAESLGLFSNGSLTAAGDYFLLELADAGFARADGTFLVWPSLFELQSNQFRPDSFRELGALSSFKFQLTMFHAMGGSKETSTTDLDTIAHRISEIYGAYRDLSQNRSMIRNEVSSNVISSVMLGEALALDAYAPDLEQAFISGLLDRQITVRPSKTIEYAITVRQDADQTS